MNQWHMGEFWYGPVECMIDLRLTKGVVKVIITANYMGYSHIVVVDHNGQVVCRATIGPQDDQIIKFAICDRDIALHAISDRRRALLRRSQPNDRWDPRRCLGGIAVAPSSVIAYRPPLRAGLLAHRLQLRRRAIAFVGATCREELPRHIGMPCRAGGLVDYFAVPREAKPVQPVDDRGHRLRRRPRAVGIFDAQAEDTPVVLCKKPIEQRGARAADMQKACRRRGE